MNKIFKFSTMLFGFSLIADNAAAIRINGTEITLGGEIGRVTYEVAPNGSNIAFKIEGEDITVGSLSNGPELLGSAKSIHESFVAQYDNFRKMISNTSINISCGAKIQNEGAYFKAGGDVNLKANESISLINTIAIVGNRATFVSPLFDINNFFLTTLETVTFKGHEESKSWLAGFEFTPLTLDMPFTYFMQGKINLTTPSTNGMFLAIGAKSITFNLRGN